MAQRSFLQRSETFGFDTPAPWALDALRLLFHTPRAYEPLVRAWDLAYPGAGDALARMSAAGFVGHQPPVIVDIRTGEAADRSGPPVPRYRATAAGQRLAAHMREDLRVLEDAFPNLTPANLKPVAKLLSALDLTPDRAHQGLSRAHLCALSGLSERTARWWVARLVTLGFARELADRSPDVREVVPEHWRVTRVLCQQLRDVVELLPEAPTSLAADFHLHRRRFLGPIDPARISLTGASDYDHDTEAQRILAAFVRSPRFVTGGIFTIEPRLILPVDTRRSPWQFHPDAEGRLFYQPDAELRERAANGQVLRTFLEYERYQTRRDAWNHVERFLGYLHTLALPFEGAVLRFVVDTEPRVRSYVALIEAFADYALDHPERLPANPVTLAVASAPRVLSASDPLDPRAWFRISLPAAAGTDTDIRPVLHKADDSPYDDYFSRSPAADFREAP